MINSLNINKNSFRYIYPWELEPLFPRLSIKSLFSKKAEQHIWSSPLDWTVTWHRSATQNTYVHCRVLKSSVLQYYCVGTICNSSLHSSPNIGKSWSTRTHRPSSTYSKDLNFVHKWECKHLCFSMLLDTNRQRGEWTCGVSSALSIQ